MAMERHQNIRPGATLLFLLNHPHVLQSEIFPCTCSTTLSLQVTDTCTGITMGVLSHVTEELFVVCVRASVRAHELVP